MHALTTYWKRVHGSYLNDTQLEQMSSLDDMFVACLAPGFIGCNASSFHYVFHPTNNQCYRYNPSVVQLAGLSNALIVDLFLGASDTQHAADPLLVKGVLAFVQHPTEYPFYISSSPFVLSPGMTYVVRVERTFYKQYNAWPFAYSECGVDADTGELMEPLADRRLFDMTRATGYAYSQNVCIEACYQMLLVAECGCHTFTSLFRFTTETTNVSFCEPEHACMNAMASKLRTDFDYLSVNCLRRCPLECASSRLVTSVVTSGWPPSAAYAKSNLASNARLAERRATQADYVKASTFPSFNLARLMFYYETLSVTQIEEQPKMTVDTLIGTIGGHLHLFLGMSLPSFVEIAVLGIRFASSLRHHLAPVGFPA